MKRKRILILLLALSSTSYASERTENYNLNKNAYFGDLHVHTKNSSDAFIFNVRATPDDAYRYAKGQAIQHTLGFSIQAKSGALDFTAVTDHAELLGVLPAMVDPYNPMSQLTLAKGIQSTNRKEVIKAFVSIIGESKTKGYQSEVVNLAIMKSAWQETIESAEKHYQPGKFTTFVGYEYSSSPNNQNLHRNVIFKSAKVPDAPFSSIDSENPEDLWKWLDKIRLDGIEALAIPHNANVSNGLMFQQLNWEGKPLDKNYAELRMRNEPLVEVTQIKGTSETHPLLSPNDEWANFELYDNLIASTKVSKKSGGFVREAYRHGLEFQASSKFNPFQFGLIGSSDSHNAGGSTEENNYHSKAGSLDGSAELRGSIPTELNKRFGGADASETFTQWGASGLTGIWAEENTRESLFDAMKRKETFATSGPRIKIRFFAGYNFSEQMLSDAKMIEKAYQTGFPMGSTVDSKTKQSPSFLVWATQDNNSAPLQRIQIIKGWVKDGKSFEQVIDVVCSDGGAVNSKTNRCANNGANVNLDNCQYSLDKGAAELKTIWKDKFYNQSQHAFYYVRVLENPSCRWSTWDAIRNGTKTVPDVSVTIQERAWSSPIWFSPVSL